MGQIQNAITGAVSSIVGAKVASGIKASKEQAEKLASEQKAQSEYLAARQQKPGLIEEADKLDLEEADLDLQITDFQNSLAGLDNSKPADRLKGAMITTDIQKAERSLQILREKQLANKMQRERVSKILNEPVESENDIIARLFPENGQGGNQ